MKYKFLNVLASGAVNFFPGKILSNLEINITEPCAQTKYPKHETSQSHTSKKLLNSQSYFFVSRKSIISSEIPTLLFKIDPIQAKECTKERKNLTFRMIFHP